MKVWTRYENQIALSLTYRFQEQNWSIVGNSLGKTKNLDAKIDDPKCSFFGRKKNLEKVYLEQNWKTVIFQYRSSYSDGGGLILSFPFQLFYEFLNCSNKMYETKHVLRNQRSYYNAGNKRGRVRGCKCRM